MTNYAVLRISGHQYKVAEGEEFLVDRQVGEPVVDVLLVSVAGKVEVGTPLATGAKVKVKVVEPEVKGEKIDVTKYKAKSRYRKHTGFRGIYTKLLLEKVTA